MQLKKWVLLLSLFALSMVCFAQQSDTAFRIIDGTKLYDAIYASVNKNIDSLEKWAANGILFFKLKIQDDYIINIKSSQKEPSLLINLVTDALKGQQVKMENLDSRSYDFILPVIYYFHSFDSPNSLHDLLKLIPEIDVKELLSKPPVDPFKQLFDINDNSSSVYGVQCIFLPWITLRGRLH